MSTFQISINTEEVTNWNQASFVKFGMSQENSDLGVLLNSIPTIEDDLFADDLGWNNLRDFHEYYSDNL